MKKSIFGCLAALLFLASSVFSQIPQSSSPLHRVGGDFYATAYNTWQGRIISGNTSTSGSQSITFLPQPLQDGTVLSSSVWTTAFTPIFINDANAEVMTPTAESTGPCPVGNLGVGNGTAPCVTITGTFVNTHGQSAIVQSGTAGLQEAINDVQQQGVSGAVGGTVVIDAAWGQYAASLPSQTATGILTAAIPFANVFVRDDRVSPLGQWYSDQPSTLTAISAPTTRSATAGNTQVISGTGTSVGGVTASWSAAAYYVCVTYVDSLGGESVCSPTYNFTATASVNINFASPAASTGAVGWRAYAGITSLNTAYLLPLTSANCTLTTAETLYNACAIGSAAIFATPTTATALRPLAFITNIYGPLFQSHTTFAYQPTRQPTTFQTHYGPFPATGSITGGQVGVIGTVAMPAGFWNYIGRTVRVSGKVALTAVNTATQTVSLAFGPLWTTGTPTTACTIVSTTNLTAAASNTAFQCDLTVNAISASAGTMMPDGFSINQLAAGTTTATTVAVDTGIAAITGLDTSDQLDMFVILSAGTAAINPAQLLDLHIEVLN